jgi:hypothetical protein
MSDLFKNHCAGCHKDIATPAINRSGKVPTVYCNRVCETTYKDREKFHVTDHRYKTSGPAVDSMTTDEWMMERINKISWRDQ